MDSVEWETLLLYLLLHFGWCTLKPFSVVSDNPKGTWKETLDFVQ